MSITSTRTQDRVVGVVSDTRRLDAVPDRPEPIPYAAPDPALLARVAHLEDRADRLAVAFTALCELLELRGLSEQELMDAISRVSHP